MELKVTIATSEHYQYFKEDIINHHCGYIISDKSSVQGLFSFEIIEDHAMVSFSYVFNMAAITLAMDSFLADHKDIQYIEYTGKQNLKRAGFLGNRYERK